MKNNINKKSSTLLKLLAAFLISSFLFSCEHPLDEIEKDLEKDKKHKEAKLFVAELHPLNNSGVTGKATFKYQQGKQFLAEVYAENLVPDRVHPQHVHVKGECPSEDAGGEDGFLGHDEIEHIVGEELIPLDDQLEPLEAGDFPTANSEGKIRYQEVTELRELISALGMKHSNIKTMEDLKLHHRVVVLHGAYVKDNQIVPPGTEGAEYMEEVPVACGVIKEAGHHHDE